LAPTRRRFERAFAAYGLPTRIRSDNRSPFAGSGLVRLSRLAVWWIRLGIIPERIGPAHPDAQTVTRSATSRLGSPFSSSPAANRPTAPRTAAARDPTRDAVPHSRPGPTARRARVDRRGRDSARPTATAGPLVRCPTGNRKDRRQPVHGHGHGHGPEPGHIRRGWAPVSVRSQGRQRMHMRRSRPVPIDSMCPAEPVLRCRFAGPSRAGPGSTPLTHRKASQIENG
jgi:hypothetical protein